MLKECEVNGHSRRGQINLILKRTWQFLGKNYVPKRETVKSAVVKLLALLPSRPTFVGKYRIMEQATFKVSSSEFNNDLVERIKNLLGTFDQKFEIFISVRPQPKSSVLQNETREEYFARLEKSKSDVENDRNLVSFTPQGFEDFVAKLKASTYAEHQV